MVCVYLLYREFVTNKRGKIISSGCLQAASLRLAGVFYQFKVSFKKGKLIQLHSKPCQCSAPWMSQQACEAPTIRLMTIILRLFSWNNNDLTSSWTVCPGAVSPLVSQWSIRWICQGLLSWCVWLTSWWLGTVCQDSIVNNFYLGKLMTKPTFSILHSVTQLNKDIYRMNWLKYSFG